LVFIKTYFSKKIFENIAIIKKVNGPSWRNLGRKIHNLFEDIKEKIINYIKDMYVPKPMSGHQRKEVYWAWHYIGLMSIIFNGDHRVWLVADLVGHIVMKTSAIYYKTYNFNSNKIRHMYSKTFENH